MSRMLQPNSTLIFVHIPKTAGSTLNSVLSRHYAPTGTYKIYGSDTDGRRLADELCQLPTAQKQRLKLVRGHWPYGLHVQLPQPSTYISFVRHPVERIVSFYYHILRTPQHYAYREGFTAEMSLLEFVEREFASDETHDGQTYFLTGCRPAHQALQQTVEEVLKRYAFVGVSEQFDESLLLLKRLFGWRNVFYFSRRVNRQRPRLRDIPRDVRAAIEARNPLDMQLYDHIQKVLQEQIDDEGASLRREIWTFRRLNSVYKRYISIRRTAAQWRAQRVR